VASRYRLPFLIGCVVGLAVGLTMAPKITPAAMVAGSPQPPRGCTEAGAQGAPVSSAYYVDRDRGGPACEPSHERHRSRT
jgi:hypothetical protein